MFTTLSKPHRVPVLPLAADNKAKQIAKYVKCAHNSTTIAILVTPHHTTMGGTVYD